MKNWFERLTQRERWMVMAAAAVVAIAVLQIGVIAPLWGGSARLEADLVDREQLLAEVMAAERAMVRGGGRDASDIVGAEESLVVIVDRTSRAAGLGPHLRGTQPGGDDSLRVRLEQAPFERLVPWLAELGDRFGVRVDTASFDQGGEPGLVNASLVLQRDL